MGDEKFKRQCQDACMGKARIDARSALPIIEAVAEIVLGKMGGTDAMQAWIFQDARHVAKQGKAASWYVGWREPDGKRRSKSCGAGVAGKTKAQKLRRKIDAELVTGTYGSSPNRTWQDFRAEYDSTMVAVMPASTARQVRRSLDAFQEAIHPAKMLGITTSAVNRFRAAQEDAPATINKHLRHLKAAFQVAVELGYLKEVPKCRMLPEPKRDVAYVPPDVFSSIYAACSIATRPAKQPYPACDWWRALLLFAYLHGWRIGEMLSLERAGVDLDHGTAFIKAESTKGRKDALAKLHPDVIERFRKIPGFSQAFFPWPHGPHAIYEEFALIQSAAKVVGPGGKPWGFHALRRSCGTLNAGRLQPGDLQNLMRHSALATTMKFYVNPLANQERALASLFVPDLKLAGSS